MNAALPAIVIPIDVIERIETVLTMTAITTADDATAVNDGINLIGKQLKAIEDWRVENKKPVLEMGRNIDGMANKAKDKFTPYDTKLRSMMKAWIAEQRRKEQEEAERVAKENAERLRLAEEARLKELSEAQAQAEMLAMMDGATAEEATQVAEEVAKTANIAALFNPVEVELEIPTAIQLRVATEFGSTGSRVAWKFTIEDESKVPREYLMVDEKKIRQAVNAGERKIAGVRIEEDIIITRRSI